MSFRFPVAGESVWTEEEAGDRARKVRRQRSICRLCTALPSSTAEGLWVCSSGSRNVATSDGGGDGGGCGWCSRVSLGKGKTGDTPLFYRQMRVSG